MAYSKPAAYFRTYVANAPTQIYLLSAIRLSWYIETHFCYQA